MLGLRLDLVFGWLVVMRTYLYHCSCRCHSLLGTELNRKRKAYVSGSSFIRQRRCYSHSLTAVSSARALGAKWSVSSVSGRRAVNTRSVTGAQCCFC